MDRYSMYGPAILVHTLSKPTRTDRHGNLWQYHPRSDHHSKVACWGIVFDLMLDCPLLRRHVERGTVKFGINHEMRDFRQNRKKNLDLVLCRPSSTPSRSKQATLATLAEQYEIELSAEQKARLSTLPALARAPVGSVLMALEAKACMTAHQRALPRLYDELNSSHLTVHGASEQAISAGFVMVNVAGRFLSPDMNKANRRSNPEFSSHTQPRDAELTIAKIHQIPRRARVDQEGYDALAVVVVDCINDGSPVGLIEESPAPPAGDNFHYASMISRLASAYATRFKEL
jgi:hypothetical protein